MERAELPPLLRIYWYDGLLRTGPTDEQEELADTDNLKLRLGVVSHAGTQKGVDSLIVTDLIELARNGAISDAVLLSGDEDVRIGVQIAQAHGVRVHLLGIEPADGNQSRALRREADTSAVLSAHDIRPLLATPDLEAGAASRETGTTDIDPSSADLFDAVVARFVETLPPAEVADIGGLGRNEPIPRERDRELLRRAGRAAGRYLSGSERHYMRKSMKRLAAERLVSQAPIPRPAP